MVQETRSSLLDMAARSKFTEPGDPVQETRTVLAELFDPPEPEDAEGAGMVFTFDDQGTPLTAAQKSHLKQQAFAAPGLFDYAGA